MQGKRATRSPRSKGLNKGIIALLSIIIVIALAFTSIVVIEYFSGGFNTDTVSTPSEAPSLPDEPEPITKVSTATISTTGDLLMHIPLITNAKLGDGYNFDSIFTYFSSYVSSADYAVANLETTLRGNQDGYDYSGYPQFNCPDEIVTAAKKSGFDMLLTANNHSYDTRLTGMKRTLEVVDQTGLDRLGTYKDDTEKRYLIKEINGIKIGMLCYTYETDGNIDKVALNGIPLNNEAKTLINAFGYKELDTFYQNISWQIARMKLEGAEATMLFIHWGEEYQTTENKTQNQIAQELCNLGIDVIVGGHPHVIQPIELLTSANNTNHKTVCIYSLGNAVSNQRKERMNLKTGHTEDGALFSVTFAKYSDGTVMLESANLLPTWVNMYSSKKTGKKVYEILPLDINIKDSWRSAFELTDASFSSAEKSYERTMKIVGSGLEEVNTYLSSLPTPDKIILN